MYIYDKVIGIDIGVVLIIVGGDNSTIIVTIVGIVFTIYHKKEEVYVCLVTLIKWNDAMIY